MTESVEESGLYCLLCFFQFNDELEAVSYYESVPAQLRKPRLQGSVGFVEEELEHVRAHVSVLEERLKDIRVITAKPARP